MVFSSIPFLFYFLPCVLLVYFLVPDRWKNGALLGASLVFYAWGEPKFLLVMLATILQGYIFGMLIEKSGDRRGKICLAVSVAISLGVLCLCKYADFFVENFNAVTGLSVPLLRLTLPIGISFYTFQIISYTVDVYRREVPAQRSFFNLATYIAMFPQLIAGPIVRYSHVENQLKRREHSVEKCALGVRRFVIGLGKKVLIANTLGELCALFPSAGQKSVLFYWLYAVAFTLHIYFDFSGYSDMAIGLGKIFGFDFPENFNYPYVSASVTEFWRRWHMSLGSWFRDYVYIPLGGNRVSKPRWMVNIFTVWMLTGLWHGAAWNFLVWGLFFGVLLMVEKLWLGKLLEKSRFLSHVYVLLAVTVSFVIFNAGDMTEGFSYLKAMFGGASLPLVSAEGVYYLHSYAVTLTVAVIGATPLVPGLLRRLREKKLGESVLSVAEPLFLLLILIAVTAYLVDGSFNPFLYFRF